MKYDIYKCQYSWIKNSAGSINSTIWPFCCLFWIFPNEKDRTRLHQHQMTQSEVREETKLRWAEIPMSRRTYSPFSPNCHFVGRGNWVGWVRLRATLHTGVTACVRRGQALWENYRCEKHNIEKIKRGELQGENLLCWLVLSRRYLFSENPLSHQIAILWAVVIGWDEFGCGPHCTSGVTACVGGL